LQVVEFLANGYILVELCDLKEPCGFYTLILPLSLTYCVNTVEV
jgi:hypothetical protein